MELNSILRYASRHNIPVVGVSCKPSSMLLRYSNIKILLPKVAEAGKTLAPTSSSLNFLSWGDSLAIACMKRKKWSNKKFVNTHPSGSLSTALIQVKDIMAKGNAIPIVSQKCTMRVAIKEMSKKSLGILCVKDKRGTISILTDGDIRKNSNNLYTKKILKISNRKPVWISDNTTALSAIEKMNSLRITHLLCFNFKKKKKISGLLHMHHCLSRGIK